MQVASKLLYHHTYVCMYIHTYYTNVQINIIFLIMALRVLLKRKSHNRTTEKRRDIVKLVIVTVNPFTSNH